MFDDTPTPKQSNTWNVWRTAADEMLDDLIEYAAARRRSRDHARAREAEAMSDETAQFIEAMAAHPEWTDELRVLRHQQFFELRHRFEALMAGVSVPPSCEGCQFRRA